MSVTKHRVAASAILLCGSLGLVAVGRTLMEDTPEVVAVRHQLDGKWVATRVNVSPMVTIEGETAARTTASFDGRHVRFAHLVDADQAEGVYNLGPDAKPGKMDFKLDAGWMLGSYTLEGDMLTISVNSLGLPEQLGVPARGRPQSVKPTPGRFTYEFRKAKP